MRTKKIDYYMMLVKVVASRSTCKRRSVGAIIVKNSVVLSTGYNGAPSGITHCIDTYCIRDRKRIRSGTRHEICKAVHAEQNAIIHAAKNGIAIEGGIMFTNTFPCCICAKMIVNAGIKTIVYDQDYPDELSLEILNEAKIQLVKYGDQDETLKI